MATLLCASVLASGCVSNPPARVGIDYCEHAEPIFWDSEQELEATPMPVVRQIVRHNERIEALCQ